MKGRAKRLLIPYVMYTALNVVVATIIPGLTSHPVNNLADFAHVISHSRVNVIRFH